MDLRNIIWFFLLLLLNVTVVTPSDDHGDVFVASSDWKEIKEGQKVPAGLHYRINLETGKKEAKILSDDEKNPTKETGAVLSEANQPVEEPEPLDQDTVAKIRAKMKKMQFNRDVEHIKFLIAHFGNSSVDDQKIILDELDYYLHQIDNAQDFVFLGGLSQVLEPALNSDHPDLVSGAAIVLGSAAQSNTNVQNSAEKAGLLKNILELIEKWSGKTNVDKRLTGRLVFALSSLIRGNEANLAAFGYLGGPKVLLRLLESSDDTKLILKILSFIADVTRTDAGTLFDVNFCQHLARPVLLLEGDLDHVEKFVDCLVQLKNQCGQELFGNRPIGQWLLNAQDLVGANQDSETDFEATLAGIRELLAALNLTKSEL